MANSQFSYRQIFVFSQPGDKGREWKGKTRCLSLHLVYIAVFGVAFLYSGSLWSSLYCRVSSLWVGLYGWLVKVS